ncbi:MAG: Gfo/Idh/MocA family oxidoreductase [Pseudomonadota bacterium]
MAKRQQLRIGFIGAGSIADLQLKLLEERTDVEVCAFADVNAQVLEARQQQFPDATTWPDYLRMLKDCALDAVSVCTPNKLHARPTIAALRSGCHVMVENPWPCKSGKPGKW